MTLHFLACWRGYAFVFKIKSLSYIVVLSFFILMHLLEQNTCPCPDVSITSVNSPIFLGENLSSGIHNYILGKVRNICTQKMNTVKSRETLFDDIPS